MPRSSGGFVRWRGIVLRFTYSCCKQHLLQQRPDPPQCFSKTITLANPQIRPSAVVEQAGRWFVLATMGLHTAVLGVGMRNSFECMPMRSRGFALWRGNVLRVT